MPIFEYVCHRCGAFFEKLVMSREAAVSCPTAGFSGSMGAGCGCAPSG